MTLKTSAVRIAGERGKAHLVFSGEDLVAVISELSADYDDEAGRWFIEAGFGPAASHPQSTFANQSEVLAWIGRAFHRKTHGQERLAT